MSGKSRIPARCTHRPGQPDAVVRPRLSAWRCGAAGPVTLTEQLIVRRFEAGEEPQLQVHIDGLSPLSRRYRFLGGINGLSLAGARRLIGDGTGPVFSLAAESHGPEGTVLVGEGVCAIGGDGTTAEFALSVADEWQGQGVGRAIVAAISLRAFGRGVDLLHGDVLRDNNRMLGLAIRAGFQARTHPGDARLVRIERRFSGTASLRARLAGLGEGLVLAA